MGHEFGHVLGLEDKYVNILDKDGQPYDSAPTSTEWTGDIMAEPTYMSTYVHKETMGIVLDQAIKTHRTLYSIQRPKDYNERPTLKWGKTTYYIDKTNCEKKNE